MTRGADRVPEGQAQASLANRAHGEIRARFERFGTRTHIARLYETGGLRLCHPRATQGCEGVILNTAGGMAGGDRAHFSFEAGPGADVTLTTQAAEKIYRTEKSPAELSVSLTLEPSARLEWLPQKTILFDQARLTRRLDAEMAADASLLLLEANVFGRLARGETSIHGGLHESWRVRRAGKLVFAEEMRLEGALGAILDRKVVGHGARATALLLLVAPDAEQRLEAFRAALEGFGDKLDHGASAWNKMLVARLASASPDLLRAAILKGLALLRGREAPRVW
jgi:urease accessory protein